MHLASQPFWDCYKRLPAKVRKLADKNFAMLKKNPKHPSLHLKKVGDIWTVRVGIHYRAVGTEVGGNMHWHWIGSHAEYDNKLP